MKLTKEQELAQKNLHSLYSMCWENEDFKRDLINSPRATIEKVSGNPMNLPESVEIVVEDQTDPNYFYLNIPAKPNYDDMALTDEQLEIVAGGEVAVSAFVGSVALSFTIVGFVATIYYSSQQ